MNIRNEEIDLIERLAVHTWPAEYTEPLGDWILRASGGFTKRANSVFTWRHIPLEQDWMQRIEAFYKTHRLPVYFHISDASPLGLDSMLEELGYAKQISCMVMTANCVDVVRLSKQHSKRNKQTDTVVSWLSSADDVWMEHFLKFEQFPENRTAFYSGLLQRVEPIKGFVKLYQNGQIAAVATAIAENGWAGFVNVVVDERCRGQGLGYRLMQALAEWSQLQGAPRLYLQVITDNNRAVRLYSNIGYTPHYSYHYRCKV